MENPNGGGIRGVLEENVLAMLDSSGARNSRDVYDDRISFLESVRAASLSPESPSPPSRKMCLRIFQILRDSTSVELAMSGFRLLTELNKRYPRVCLANSELGGCESSSTNTVELVVVQEAWLPFNSGAEICSREDGGGLNGSVDLFDLSSFSSLVGDIAQEVNKLYVKTPTKAVRDMLVFQYLVDVLEADFIPRHTKYLDTLNWLLLRESVLNIFLGSRKNNFKNLVRDCLSTLYQFNDHEGSSLQDSKHANKISMEEARECNIESGLLVAELRKGTCASVQKLLALIMDLDLMWKEADLRGATSRVDGVRTPLLEMILDELCYNRESMCLFVEVFFEPRWKLEIILQYFWKYCNKPSVQTRRSTASSDDVTFRGVLSLFSTTSSTKNIARKITPQLSQLLLSHAFQAYLSLQHYTSKCSYGPTHAYGVAPLSQICNDVILAFQNLQKTNDLQMSDFEKGAVFNAVTISSKKSYVL